MALHPVKLPKSAARLFRVVILQKKLLNALADPDLDARVVNIEWVQQVWRRMDPEWVRKFCRKGQMERIDTIAHASLTARQALYAEFCRQHKVGRMLSAGGNFRDLRTLPGFTIQLTNTVREFFTHCYKLLGDDMSRKWSGYTFRTACCISNRSYKDDFCKDYPTVAVCPYCDGDIGTAELDHYLCKSRFPLLACSPWNLVPVCSSCNRIGAKGDRPAITIGPPHCADHWLHPFFRPASPDTKVTLNGSSRASIPELHSPDVAEQQRLCNHTELIRTLAKRWTNTAAASFDELVREVNRRLSFSTSLQNLVDNRLQDHLDSRGKSPFSLIKAAVCRAVLELRPEYLEEFASPNPPVID